MRRGTVERMRELYETTRLSVRAIGAQTGADAATVSRRARRYGWLRPTVGVPEEHFSPQGRRKLRRGAIAKALLRRAEHLAFQREMDQPRAPASSDRPSASSAPPAPSTRRSARSSRSGSGAGKATS